MYMGTAGDNTTKSNPVEEHARREADRLAQLIYEHILQCQKPTGRAPEPNRVAVVHIFNSPLEDCSAAVFHAGAAMEAPQVAVLLRLMAMVHTLVLRRDALAAETKPLPDITRYVHAMEICIGVGIPKLRCLLSQRPEPVSLGAELPGRGRAVLWGLVRAL